MLPAPPAHPQPRMRAGGWTGGWAVDLVPPGSGCGEQRGKGKVAWSPGRESAGRPRPLLRERAAASPAAAAPS
jgi:hypothetical protein